VLGAPLQSVVECTHPSRQPQVVSVNASSLDWQQDVVMELTHTLRAVASNCCLPCCRFHALPPCRLGLDLQSRSTMSGCILWRRRFLEAMA
jgi:hypothetical protein